MRVKKQPTIIQDFPSRWGRLLFISICIFSIWIASFPNAAMAQVGRMRGGQDEIVKQSATLEVPRSLRTLVEDAESAIKRKQYGEATLALGTVLGLEQTNLTDEIRDTAPRGIDGKLLGEGNRRGNANRRVLGSSDFGQDYFLDSKSDTTLNKSMRTHAFQLLASLPEEGQKFVELRYGVNAQSQLDLALKRNDWTAVNRIAADYGFTSAGRVASWLAVEYWLGQGEAYAAAVIAENLLQQPKAREQFGTDLAVLAAVSWREAGVMTKSLRVLREAKEHWANAKWTWKGESIATEGGDAAIEASIAALDLGISSHEIRRNSDWPTSLGRADGNAHSQAGISIFRWDFHMHGSPQDTASALHQWKNRQTKENADLPSRTPLVVGPWVLVRTYDQRLLGFNQITGKQEWNGALERAPWSASSLPNWNESARDNAYSERVVKSVWSDVSMGQLSSDGVHVYGLCETTMKQSIESMVQGPNSIVAQSGRRQTHNSLRAWHLQSQGKFQWEVGGENGEGEPLLAGVLFLGAPTPHRGELLILGELNGEVFLLSLSPETGKLNWSQQLVANENQRVANDPSRRCLAANPTVYGNMVICPTLSGYTIGYDLVSRSLVWAQRYDQIETRRDVNGFRGTIDESFNLHAPRSIDYAPIVADGCVMVMPCEPEAKNLSVLDVQTGRELWKVPQSDPKKRWRYVAGVWNGKLLLVGDTQAIALQLATGEKVWNAPIEFGSKVAGRGVRNGGRYSIPLSSQEILEIDIDQGVATGRTRMGMMLGNLAATDRSLLSFSPTHLSYCVLRSRLQRDIDIESLRDPNSSKALANRAEILHSEGKLEESFIAIRDAYRREPENPDAIALLSKISIAGIKSDFERFGPMVREFDSILIEGTERPVFLTVLIDGYIRQGKVEQALQLLFELSEERNRNPSPTSNVSAETIELEKNLSVHIDRWIATRIERIDEVASPEQRKKIEAMVQSRMAGESRAALGPRRSMKHWLGLPSLSSLGFDVAKEMRRTGDWSSADLALNQLLGRENESIRPAAAEELVDMYSFLGRTSTAMQIAKRFGTPNMGLLAKSNSKRMQMDRQFQYDGGLPPSTMESKDVEAIDKTLGQWPTGMIYIDGPSLDAMDLPDVPLNVLIHEGDALRGWSFRISASGSEVILRNPWGFETIRVRFRMEAGGISDGVFNAHVLHNMVYLELPTELIAIDTLQMESSKAVRWRIPVPGGIFESVGSYSKPSESDWGEKVSRPNREFSVLAVSQQGVHVQNGDELQCLSLLTGDKIWARRPVERGLAVSRSGNKLYVLEKNSSQSKNETKNEAIKTSHRLLTLDCRDGSLLASSGHNQSLNFRVAVGSKMLFHNKQKEIQLWDPETDRVLLERKFDKEIAQGCLVEGKSFVVLERGKKDVETRLYYWNLEKGTESIYRLSHSGYDGLYRSVRCTRYGNSIVVFPSARAYDIEVQTLPPLGRQFVSGPMMAISDEDGHPLWSQPVVAHSYYYIPSPCQNSPVIVLARRLKTDAGDDQIRARPERTSVAILDVRNGETLFESHALPSTRGTGVVQTVQPSKNMTTVSCFGLKFEIVFTEDDRPPAALGSVGNVTPADLNRIEKGMSTRVDDGGGNSGDDPFGIAPGMNQPGMNPFGQNPFGQDPFGPRNGIPGNGVPGMDKIPIPRLVPVPDTPRNR